MYYRVKLLPVRERTLCQFTAPNPWNGKSAEEWSVEQFQMAPKHAVKRGVTPAMTCRPGTPATVKGSYGLRSDSDGSIRMFPVGLTKAWVQKEAPDAALPEILHKLPKLKRTDFERPVAATFLLCILCIAAFCLGLAAIILPGALHSKEHGASGSREGRDCSRWSGAISVYGYHTVGHGLVCVSGCWKRPWVGSRLVSRVRRTPHGSDRTGDGDLRDKRVPAIRDDARAGCGRDADTVFAGAEDEGSRSGYFPGVLRKRLSRRTRATRRGAKSWRGSRHLLVRSGWRFLPLGSGGRSVTRRFTGKSKGLRAFRFPVRHEDVFSVVGRRFRLPNRRPPACATFSTSSA